jgi:hypothetical protein
MQAQAVMPQIKSPMTTLQCSRTLDNRSELANHVMESNYVEGTLRQQLY